jgi:hypothetical protein
MFKKVEIIKYSNEERKFINFLYRMSAWKVSKIK